MQVDIFTTEEEMDEELALHIIENDDGDADNESRVLDAWQYLLDTEAYLHLAPKYERTITDLVERGVIG